MRTHTPFLAISAAALILAGQSSARAQTAVPVVTVDNATVQFNGQPPVEQNGSILVPLRGVLEKLGAYVGYDGPSQTVTAFRGQTHITLTIGSQQAMVNQTPVTLENPAQTLNGSTMVPLRFVAEALGAQVNFDVSTNTVSIVTHSAAPPAMPPQNGPDGAWHNGDHHDSAWHDAMRREAERRRQQRLAPPPVPSDKSITGTVLGVYEDVSPSRIVVQTANGQEQTIPLRPDAALTIQRPNAPEQKIPLDQVNPGAKVTILTEPDGTASAVNLLDPPRPAPQKRNLPPVSGVFKGVYFSYIRHGDLYQMIMVDGRRIDVPRDVPVLYDNERLLPSDVRTGDVLVVSVDPVTHRGTRIVIAPEK